MQNLGNIRRSLRRHGVASFRIIADRIICNLPSAFSHKTIAQAANRIYRWPVANLHWDRVRIDKLSSEELLQMATSLLRNKRWQDAINVVDFAGMVNRGTIRLELAKTEALWQLKDSAGVQSSREKAIAYLTEPTEAEISLIRNENQVVNISSRLELLWATQPRLSTIKKLATEIPVVGEASKAFTFWDSGFENSPKIVKVCQSQLKQVFGESLVQLDSKNLEKWLPVAPELKRVARLWPANFSDAIRVGLLARHGGAWLDATILASVSPLAEAKNHDLFVYRYNGPRIASWFMLARPGSYQARMLYAAMLDYWQHNRKLKNYFLFHDFVEVLYHLDPEFKKAFDNEPNEDARPSLALHRSLWKSFDQAEFTSALAKRSIQKLTYKPGTRPHGEGTTYHWLLQAD